ncbi:MAG: LLM class flavin-dependent oxidoreductase, partial [Candidatus Binataceae bacterium]
MDIGIGLPTTVPGLDGRTLIEWARRAETCGFQSVAAIDRLVYFNCEPMLALASRASSPPNSRWIST